MQIRAKTAAIAAVILIVCASAVIAQGQIYELVNADDQSHIAFFECSTTPKEHSVAWFEQNCTRAQAGKDQIKFNIKIAVTDVKHK